MKFVGVNVSDHLAALLDQRVIQSGSTITKVVIAALEHELDPNSGLTLIQRVKNIEDDIHAIKEKLNA